MRHILTVLASLRFAAHKPTWRPDVGQLAELEAPAREGS